jgi:hypothetical protein
LLDPERLKDHQLFKQENASAGGATSSIRPQLRKKLRRSGNGRARNDDPDGSADEELQAISWDEFFRVFDDRELEFLHRDRTEDGGAQPLQQIREAR